MQPAQKLLRRRERGKIRQLKEPNRGHILQIRRDLATQSWRILTARSQNEFLGGLLGLPSRSVINHPEDSRRFRKASPSRTYTARYVLSFRNRPERTVLADHRRLDDATRETLPLSRPWAFRPTRLTAILNLHEPDLAR